MVDARAGRGASLLLWLLCGLFACSALLLLDQALRPVAWVLPGIRIDRLSAVMTLLVSGVGAVAFRFALRYLDGEPGQPRFLRWLFVTVVAAYVLMLASNLVLLFLAWSLTSLGLHQLLTFYRNRPEAQRPARKKFLISRLGDVALLAAIALIWLGWGTLDLHSFLGQLEAAPAATPAVAAVALLIVAASLTKSAQFPFHSWLPETMEAPTPVSALMHAGIINAGGVLLLRFAPLLLAVPSALFTLVLIGTLTASLGMLAMWAQTDVKRTLAWSTVGQMGFMMVQCGLAAFPVAALHILGHGCYKAWSFLRSGGLPAPAPYTPAPAPARSLGQALLGTLLAIPALILACWLTGFAPLHSPGELALTAILALSIGQLWAALERSSASSAGDGWQRVGLALLLTFGVALAALALYSAAAAFFAPVFGDLPVPSGPLAWVAAALPVIAFATLGVLYLVLPRLMRSARGRALHIHALHGFYLGALANRLVDRVWNSFSARSVNHA